ncbi:hypothetical protein C8R45DRAFT_524773 [Mycena sanguinolenta]|nr:hypothetical protein C8R45DRAFT_524773 [Mycena sanguinolenta]
MDHQPHLDAEFNHSTICDPESTPNASGIFSNSQKFTVMGGTFTNFTNHYAAPSLPADFRMIPMGDIDLRREIRLEKYTDVAYSQLQRACVRRIHSAKAKIDGRKSRVTVAMYQGYGAEEEWRKDIAKYMSLRHPNIVQICCAASSNGIYATLFYDALIPVQEILDRYRDSHFATVYIYAHCNQDFSEAFNYLYSAFQRALCSWNCTSWIRHSTGRLCTELTPSSDNLQLDWVSAEFAGLFGISSLGAGAKTIMVFIDSLTLEQYHRICDLNLRQYRHFDLSASTTTNLGAVSRCSSDQPKDSIEIAFLPTAKAPRLNNWTSEQGTAEVMPDGWTRFQSGDVINNTVYLSLDIFPNWYT